MINKISKHPYFENSVRTFFPLAALWAVLIPAYTVCVLVNNYPFIDHFFSIIQWHAYELLFNFFYTLVAGFILTAAGHWTNVGPLGGRPLFFLWTLWIFDKIAIYITSNGFVAATLSLVFPIMFTYHLYQLLKTYKIRNLFIGMISVIPILRINYILNYSNVIDVNISSLYEVLMWVILMLISIIAGRVIPVFTKNYLELKSKPAEPTAVKITTFLLTGAILLTGLEQLPDFIKFVIVTIAGILHCIRLGFWKGNLALRHPIIAVLHFGYLIFALSIIFKGFSYILPELTVFRAEIHFMLAGGVSLIALNIMIRATLGHTGREIKMDKSIASMNLFLFLGFMIRVFVPIYDASLFLRSLHHAMGFWTLAFLIYLIKFLPMCLRKRIG